MADHMTPSTSVTIGSLQLKNPVLTASGTFGYGEEFADFMNLADLWGDTDVAAAIAPLI